MMKVNGTCAIVTGGASGIGKALVERLLSKGAKFVAIIDINKKLGEKTVEDFKEKFGAEKVRFIHCDVTSESELEEAFQKSYSEHGCLDVVVNNAGLLMGPKEQVLRVNLEAVIRGSYLAKKYMSKQNGGSGGLLINMSSLAGFIPSWNPVYAATKHGVKGFSLTLTDSDPSFAQDDIRVGVICPTSVDTPIFDSSPELKTLLGYRRTVVRLGTSDKCLTYPPVLPRSRLAYSPFRIDISHCNKISRVVDAFLLVIEDDTKHGCCVRITEANGIDLLPMKTVSEWAAELKIYKS